jgi:hypothetical protein
MEDAVREAGATPATIGVLDAPDETLVHEGHEPLENADATELVDPSGNLLDSFDAS